MFARLVVKKLSAMQMDHLMILSTSSLAGILYCTCHTLSDACFDVWSKNDLIALLHSLLLACLVSPFLPPPPPLLFHSPFPTYRGEARNFSCGGTELC
jgi:hypothetical protein